MATGRFANQKIQMGAEGTPGLAIPATTIYRGIGQIEDARDLRLVTERLGVCVPSNRVVVPGLLAKCTWAATPATFHQLPYILEAGISIETPTPDSGTGDVYAYEMGKAAVNTLRSYTIEGGDNVAAEEMEYSFVEKFVLSGKYGDFMQMSANWTGRQVTSSAFTGSLSVPTVEEINAMAGALYIDAVSGTMGNTPITAGTLLEFNLDVTTGWKPRFCIDDGKTYFLEPSFDVDAFKAICNLTFRHTTAGAAERAKFAAETPAQIRLKFVGSTLTTPGTYTYHTLQIDMTGIYTKAGTLENDMGDSTTKLEFTIGYDETADISPLAFLVVVDDYAALP